MSKFEQLSESFVRNYFFTYAEAPRHNKGLRNYQGGCPMCREGKSWKRKHRFYYIPEKNLVFCQNCGYSKPPILWISDVTGRHVKDIYKEFKETSQDISVAFAEKTNQTITKKALELPFDAFDLSNTMEIERWRKMGRTAFEPALSEIHRRKLDVAVNRGKLFFSFTDYSHSNRIIIPFYDFYGKLTYFQSRAVGECSDGERYISSGGYDKTIYGIERIDIEKPYIFIQEGPFDTFFLKNSVAVGGINEKSDTLFTLVQKKQLDELFGIKRIWILDNQNIDSSAANKLKILDRLHESYFIWPNIPELAKIKDLNDYCISTNTIEVKEDFIIENSKIFD
jgi:hypothetical protein